MHEALRQRIAVLYHLEGLSREELDANPFAGAAAIAGSADLHAAYSLHC
jgi:hypothetical protein